MISAEDLLDVIEKEILDFLESINDNLIYVPSSYLLSLGGKRIRPLLLLMAHQMFNNNIKTSLPAALAIELFHNFTLLHDDIMDESIIRRGQATVNKKWSNNTAILSGDIMLVHSYRLLNKLRSDHSKEIFEVFNTAALEVCEGQYMDMVFEDRNDVNIDEYIKMIQYKTAALLSASMKIGAINAGANDTSSENLYDFGKNIGIAFQLNDDFLDVFGDTENLGKKIGGDIMMNKKTYLYLKSLELSNNKQKKDLLYYYSLPYNHPSIKEKILEVKHIFKSLKIDEITKDLIFNYNHQAISFLDKIPSDYKSILQDFSQRLLNRSN